MQVEFKPIKPKPIKLIHAHTDKKAYHMEINKEIESNLVAYPFWPCNNWQLHVHDIAYYGKQINLKHELESYKDSANNCMVNYFISNSIM